MRDPLDGAAAASRRVDAVALILRPVPTVIGSAAAACGTEASAVKSETTSDATSERRNKV